MKVSSVILLVCTRPIEFIDALHQPFFWGWSQNSILKIESAKIMFFSNFSIARIQKN
jgi:hypothetical protein